MEDVFLDKLAFIDSAAYLYGRVCKAEDYELIAALEEKSEFDWMRFIACDGTDYASDGRTTNVKDREYFMNGMAGESGICEVPVSRINGEKLLVFYAPVYYNNEICGVMVGFLSEELAYNKVNALMRCVTEEYVYLIDVDLETQQEVQYSLASGSRLRD